MSSESKMENLTKLRNEAEADSSARQRLLWLFDEGSFKELDTFAKSEKALAGVITGYGYVDGNPVYAFSQDKAAMGGAVGKAHAAKISKLYDLAAKTGVPVVGVFDSNGADLSEGIDALAAYGDMLMRTSNLSGVVPQVSVIAGTCAGSAALIAAAADFVVMTKVAEFFVAPPFLTDPKGKVGAGTAANAAKSGAATLVCDDDAAAIDAAKRLITLLPANNLSSVPMFEYAESDAAIAADAKAETLVASIADADSVVELSAAFGTAAFTALATVQGATVGFAATNKTDAKLTAADCAKLARFVRTCDAFSIPVITIVDTEGLEPSAQGELSGSVRDMTKLAYAYAEATTVKISLVTGKAYGAAYIALAGTGANADLTYAWPQAVISALAPETAVEFLWHDKLAGAADVAAKRAELICEYSDTVASPIEAAAKGYIEDIIEPAATREAIISALEITAGKRIVKLAKKHSNMPF